jgi:hypothetical protein
LIKNEDFGVVRSFVFIHGMFFNRCVAEMQRHYDEPGGVLVLLPEEVSQ